jgi:transcriptional regulator with XRE-family HTH domain
MRKYVGERIQKLREAQGLSRERVSELAGVPLDKIEAYEKGSAVPSIGVVIKLSRVLGSKVEGMLHGGAMVSEAITICRAGESHSGPLGSTDQSYGYVSLTRPGTGGHLMQPFLLTFDPKSPAGPPISHDGQEFVFIIEGTIELLYDGRSHLLNIGDSAYIDSAKPHTFHGVGSSVAKMLAVVSS